MRCIHSNSRIAEEEKLSEWTDDEILFAAAQPHPQCTSPKCEIKAQTVRIVVSSLMFKCLPSSMSRFEQTNVLLLFYSYF